MTDPAIRLHGEVSLPFFATFDLNRLSLLPPSWDEQIRELATTSSRTLNLDPGVPPRPDNGTEPIGFDLVPGSQIAKSTPWLYELYLGRFRDLAESSSGLDVVTAEHFDSQININLIHQGMVGYPVHSDSNPVTGLLFVTTHERTDGGTLIFEGQELRMEISPVSGYFIVFGGMKCPHYVTPPHAPHRITAVMNYYFAGEPQPRPPGLDDFLYGSDSD